MKRLTWFVLVLMLQGTFVYAQLVFPDAEGFGANHRSAYSGSAEPRILVVNSLLDTDVGNEVDGKGTLRWCLTRTYPRIVLFEVGGTIKLLETLEIENPYLLVAGQSAPSPGILVTTSTTVIKTHHVLFQHLSFRAGDDPNGSKPESRDCIAIFTGACHDITIDHCSMLWGLDENFSTWGDGDPINNITVSNCIIAQGLNYSISPDGGHSKGLLMGYLTRNLSILKNYIAHNDDRTPLLQGGTESEVVNNIIYNAPTVVSFNSYDEVVTDASVINNKIVKGYDLTEDHVARFVYMNTSSRVYLSGNTNTSNDWDYIIGNSLGDQVRVDNPPISSGQVQLLSREQLDDYILENVGSRQWERNEVDQQVLDEYRNGTGRVVDCVDAEEVWYNEGTAVGATQNTITLDQSASGENRAYEFKSIEILSGTGAGQRRDVASYEGSNHLLTVSSNWDVIPDGSSNYTMIVNCGNNAGGWRLLASSFGEPDIPEDPHGDSNSNGYTNLEDWIYSLTQVGGNPVIPVTEIVVTGTGGVSVIDVDGGTLQMLAEVLPVDATYKSVTWSVDNGTGEATINSTGLLTAVSDGTVTVSATSADGLVRGDLVVTISNQDPVVPVTQIVVTGTGGVTIIDVAQGTLQMLAQVLPQDATNKSVTWSVANGTGQATISTSGLLTAVSDGTVTVSATSADGLVSGDLVVTISNQGTTGIFDREVGPEVLVIGNSILINLTQADPSWKDGTLRVFSLTGAEIYISPMNQGNNQIDIHNGPGIYILMLQSPDEIISRKVFIDR